MKYVCNHIPNQHFHTIKFNIRKYQTHSEVISPNNIFQNYLLKLVLNNL